MKLILAKSAGFCFGVRRAVTICEKAAETCPACATLGPIIHNRSVTANLAAKGVRELAAPEDARPGDTVIIRSHGAKKGEIEALRATGAEVIDATCPDVSKIHEIVRRESAGARKILIIGEKEHPEVEAISSWCDDCRIIETPEELRGMLAGAPDLKNAPLAVVFQTTSTQEVYEACLREVKKECTNLKIFDTICSATYRRQEEAKEISRTMLTP